MMELMTLLKPPPFKCKKVGDQEQLLQDFMLYRKTLLEFFRATDAAGQHEDDHIDCGACKKAKSIVKLVGGVEMVKLFEHVGKASFSPRRECALDLHRIRQNIC